MEWRYRWPLSFPCLPVVALLLRETASQKVGGVPVAMSALGEWERSDSGFHLLGFRPCTYSATQPGLSQLSSSLIKAGHRREGYISKKRKEVKESRCMRGETGNLKWKEVKESRCMRGETGN
jgi:hypothetical protein